MHWLLGVLAFHASWFGTLVKGSPVLLIKDGSIQQQGMRRAGLSQHDLEQALRLRANQTDPRRSSSPTWSEMAASASFPASTNHASSMCLSRTACRPFGSSLNDRGRCARSSAYERPDRPLVGRAARRYIHGRVPAMSASDPTRRSDNAGQVAGKRAAERYRRRADQRRGERPRRAGLGRAGRRQSGLRPLHQHRRADRRQPAGERAADADRHHQRLGARRRPGHRGLSRGAARSGAVPAGRADRRVPGRSSACCGWGGWSASSRTRS